jgi:hypothetical protein
MAGHPAFGAFVDKLSWRSSLTPKDRDALMALTGREVVVQPHRDVIQPGEQVAYSCLVMSGMAARFGQLRDGHR